MKDYYTLMGENISKMVMALAKSDEIRKLLYNNEKNGFELAAPTIQAVMEGGYILQKPFIPEDENSICKVRVTIVPTVMGAGNSNKNYINTTFSIAIHCHESCWELNGNVSRVFRLLSEIDKIINNMNLNGIGRVHNAGCELIGMGAYSGYSMSYVVQENGTGY